MPRRKEEDPTKLLERKRRQREKVRLRMQKHRAKAKGLVTAMLSHALTTVCDRPNMPTCEAQSLAERTAQAILKNTLQRHGVTQDRIVRVVSEGLDSMRTKEIGGVVSSQPDTQYRLRASDVALKLLERAGEVPGLRHAEPVGTIRVNVLMMGDDNTEQIKTITAEKTDK